MAFGAVLLAWPGGKMREGPTYVTTSENSAAGGFGSSSSDGNDDWFTFEEAALPATSPLFDPTSDEGHDSSTTIDETTPFFTASPTIDTTPVPNRRPLEASPPLTAQPLRPPSRKDPSASPTIQHSSTPSVHVSGSPSASPSASPTAVVTIIPTTLPTNLPTSSIPTESPTFLPSTGPTNSPTPSPSVPPTSTSMPSTSNNPTKGPLFSTQPEPTNPNATYFNYNTTEGAKFGPSVWDHVMVLNSSEHNYWKEFGFVENQCNNRKIAQSPIDVCTKPKRHCVEYHEFRSKRGDFRISDELMIKQILPNKLRVLVYRRLGEEPDPPHVDFAGVGAKDLDLLNIDIKIPSEHTVCGVKYDGEMQYYFFHPVKKSLLVVAWLFEAKAGNPVNDHMQYLIDTFQKEYDENEEFCIQKSLQESSVGTMTLTRTRDITNAPTTDSLSEEDPSERKLAKNGQRKGGGGIWDPFHSDIQKTIHFWGYRGSLTEPPCAGSTLWRIMDVPVQISVQQLSQMQNILFNNREKHSCDYTSTHYKGSVARPIINDNVQYYKCTRSDYVSDDERKKCGDVGCTNDPFGPGLDPYVEPIIHVTGPPSDSPTIAPTESPLLFYALP